MIYDWNLNELMPLLEWINNNDKIDSVSLLAPKQPNYTEVDKEWRKGNTVISSRKMRRKPVLLWIKCLKIKAIGKG